MLPMVSIVIPNFNGEIYLKPCLASLAKLDYPAGLYEVIVVDNASADGSAALICREFPAVKLVASPVNLGFAGGCNLGINSSGAEFIALLNNDTVVDPAWLAELVSVAADDGAVGIVTSKILFMDRPGVINNAGSVLYRSGSGGDRGFGEKDEGQYDRVEEVFSACGASMLLRAGMLRETGLFDESFFCYWEDTDLSWRARLMGWKVVYSHRSIVHHLHSATSVEWSAFFTYHVLRNGLYIMLKNAWAGMVIKVFARFLRNTAFSVLLSPVRGMLFKNGDYFSLAVRLKVAGSVIKNLPSLLAKRRSIRSRARVGDDAVKAWLV